MRSILVTGGCGFIGSHTCVSLLREGFKIFVIDSNINSSPKSLESVLKIFKNQGKNHQENIYFFKGDICNLKDVEKVFYTAKKLGFSIEGVIHFAGLKSVSESIKNPLLYWMNNVYGTLNLLKIMEKYACFTIVFSSSATVYGVNDDNLITELSEVKPINPYGRTKLIIENVLKDLFDSNKDLWRIINLRYFNPIGAHSSGLIGERPVGIPNNLFPYICQVGNKEKDLLQIFGNDWPTNDGTCIRDFIHVMDLAEAHLNSINFLINNDDSKYLILNIGTGKGTSVLELVRVFEKVNNCTIPLKFVERRDGDLCKIVADNRLAFLELNWEPKRTIEDMCKDGWNWQSKNSHGFH